MDSSKIWDIVIGQMYACMIVKPQTLENISVLWGMTTHTLSSVPGSFYLGNTLQVSLLLVFPIVFRIYVS